MLSEFENAKWLPLPWKWKTYISLKMIQFSDNNDLIFINLDGEVLKDV